MKRLYSTFFYCSFFTCRPHSVTDYLAASAEQSSVYHNLRCRAGKELLEVLDVGEFDTYLTDVEREAIGISWTCPVIWTWLILLLYVIIGGKFGRWAQVLASLFPCMSVVPSHVLIIHVLRHGLPRFWGQRRPVMTISVLWSRKLRQRMRSLLQRSGSGQLGGVLLNRSKMVVANVSHSLSKRSTIVTS